jgi:alkylresorcinol/alkylpyrone synthase
MTFVTAALFGDGAGAVLMVGRDHPLAQKSPLKVINNRSNWLPNTEYLVRVDTIRPLAKVS